MLVREDIVIKKLIPKGDWKNYYWYDKDNNAYDLQIDVRMWARRLVTIWGHYFEGIYDTGRRYNWRFKSDYAPNWFWITNKYQVFSTKNVEKQLKSI